MRRGAGDDAGTAEAKGGPFQHLNFPGAGQETAFNLLAGMGEWWRRLSHKMALGGALNAKDYSIGLVQLSNKIRFLDIGLHHWIHHSMSKMTKHESLQARLLDLLSKSDSPVVPSERALAEKFAVNRLTVQRALLALEGEKHIRKVPGRGYVRVTAGDVLWPLLPGKERLIGFPIWYDSLADADWLRSPYTVTLLRGIQENLRLEGYQLDIHAVGNADAPMAEKVNEVCRRWQAIIRISPPDGTHDVNALSERLDHTVFIDSAAHLRCNRVAPDLLRAGQLAMRALVEGGARSILFLGRLDDRRPSMVTRIEGFESVLREHPECTLHAADSETRMEDGYQALLHLIRSGKSFDGIIGTSDHAAIGAMRACHEHGLRIPEDIQVVGWGGYSISSFCIPSLTTVDLHIKQTGAEAARMAIRLIRQQGKPQTIHDVSVSLIQGESTAPFLSSPPKTRISGKKSSARTQV